MEITKDLTLGELLDNFPETAEALFAVGMHCLGCPSARGESIAQAAEVHGVDVDELLKAIKSCIAK